MTETAVEAAYSAEALARHPDTGEGPFVAAGALSVARVAEDRDSYPAVVAMLNERWRVIDGRCGLQWILQRRQGQAADGWRGSAYCRTRDGLLSNIRERAVAAGGASVIFSMLRFQTPQIAPLAAEWAAWGSFAALGTTSSRTFGSALTFGTKGQGWAR